MDAEHFDDLIVILDLGIFILVFLFYLLPFLNCFIFHWFVEIGEREKTFKFFHEHFFVCYCDLFNLANDICFDYWFFALLNFLWEFYRYKFLFVFAWIKELLLLNFLLQISHNIHFQLLIAAIDGQEQIKADALDSNRQV